MTRVYNAFFIGQILLEVTAVLVFIEGVFLAEEFVGLLKIANKRLGFIDPLPWLVAYKAPEILDLALPLALVIGVYRVLLRLREQRELLILAAAGISAQFLLRRVALVAVMAFGLSVWVSGFVEPQANFAYRKLLFDAQYEVLRGRLVPERFYSFNGLFIRARARDEDGKSQRIFVYDTRDAEASKIITAASSDLVGPADDGRYRLQLKGFNMHTIAHSDLKPQPGAPQGDGSRKSDHLAVEREDGDERGPILQTVRARGYSKQLAIDGLLTFTPRAQMREEWNILELAGLTPAPGPRTPRHIVEASQRMARSLLCILAPFIAMLAVALTRRETRTLALPFACGVMMCCDVALSLSANLLANMAKLQFTWVFAYSLAVVGATGFVVSMIARQEELLRPKLERS